MDTPSKTPWGMSLVHFLAIAPEVKKLLEQALPRRHIYNLFVEQHKISFSYVTFCALVKTMFPEAIRKSMKTPPSKRKNPQAKIPEQPSRAHPQTAEEVPSEKNTVANFNSYKHKTLDELI